MLHACVRPPCGSGCDRVASASSRTSRTTPSSKRRIDVARLGGKRFSPTMRVAVSMAQQVNPPVDRPATSNRIRADSATSGLLSSHSARIQKQTEMRRIKVVCSCLDKRSSMHTVHDWLFGKPNECVDCVMPYARSIRQHLQGIQQKSLHQMLQLFENTFSALLQDGGLTDLHPNQVQHLLVFLETSGEYLDMMLETEDMIRRQKHYLSLLVDMAQETNADVFEELKSLYAEADSEHTLYMSVNTQRALVNNLKGVVRRMGHDVPV